MKVKELIEKLQQADPNLEVMASGLIQVPSDQGGPKTIANPEQKYPVESVKYIKDFTGDLPEEFILVGFDDSILLSVDYSIQ
jgi:hypothetical protein